MKNHNTFNLANSFDIDNWVIAFMAIGKMLSFFWPAVLVFVVFMILEKKNEVSR